MRNLSMKKFGTPTRAGPGVASEKVGFEGAGEPSGLESFGAGTTVGASVGFGFGAAEQSRPEVEVEWSCLPQTLVEPLRPPCTFVCTPAPAWEPLVAPWPDWPGVAVACGVAVDVADGAAPGVADCVGAGLTVVCTGEGIGDAVAVLEGVGAGVEVDVCVGAGAAGVLVCAGVVAGAVVVVAAGVASGVLAGGASWAVASAPRVAAYRAAPARPVAMMRRVKSFQSRSGAATGKDRLELR
jgi:hypothetical protein